MKVHMTSTSYPSTYADWRGVFIAHLTDALARHPGVLLSVWCPPGEMSGNVVQTMSDSDRTWLAALMEGGGIAHQMRKGGFRASCEWLACSRGCGGCIAPKPMWISGM